MLANGIIIYEGPSQLNNEPIVCILTGLRSPSSNTKTGPMLQTWVIPQSVPSVAIKEKKDESVCGDCPLRGNVCYVNPVTLNNIYRAYKKDLYLRGETNLQLVLQHIKLHKLKVRLTAYGEAPAVPFDKLKPLMKNYTAYTHQWRNPNIDPRWRGKLQASVHSLPEAREAWAAGWSTFRITLEGEEPVEEEVLCKNIVTGVQCQACGLCKGSQNITDPIHGLRHKQNSFIKMRTESEQGVLTHV